MFEFLIGSRAARFDPLADGGVATGADGAPEPDSAAGTAQVTRTSP